MLQPVDVFLEPLKPNFIRYENRGTLKGSEKSIPEWISGNVSSAALCARTTRY
jgi:hypothetical protein